MITLEEIKNKLKSNGKYWIAFTGDSITSCEWVHPNWREIVQYVLQTEMTDYLKGDWKLAEWGIKGFNFGYDGATTQDILNKISEIKMVKPDLAIGLMGASTQVSDVFLKEIVKKLDNQVVWSNAIPYNRNLRKSIKYEEWAQDFTKIPVIKNLQKLDMFNIYRNFNLDRFFTFISREEIRELDIRNGDLDYVHPNQLGNAYIAMIILKEVFGIEFDPDKYWSDTLNGKKLPRY